MNNSFRGTLWLTLIIFAYWILLTVTNTSRAELIQIPRTGKSISGAQASNLVHDVEGYDSFETIDAGDQEVNAVLCARPDATRLPSNAIVRLANRQIDTAAPEKNEPSASMPSTSSGLLKIVQFKGPIKNDWLVSLATAGAIPIQYLPNYAYLVWASDSNQTKLASAQGVRWVGIYKDSDKIDSRLTTSLAKPSVSQNSILKITVQAASIDANAVPTVSAKAAASGAKFVSSETVPGFEHLRFELPVSAITELAESPYVTWIELTPEYHYSDERADEVAAGSFASSAGPPTCVVPGYSSFLSARGVDGTGMVVQVIDGGLDKGIATNLPGTAHADLLGRIAGIQNATADLAGSDLAGHGTINAGIIMGNASLGVRDGAGFLFGLGVAPQARVFATKIFRSDGSFDIGTHSFNDLVATGYQNSAIVSSNSWGSDSGGAYTSDSQVFDALARDASSSSSGNQGMLFVFAAGNAGPSVSTLDSPASGKNVIAAGASENCDAGATDQCAVPPAGADNIEDLIDFSSRGPTSDGRFGVTITAPGTHIQGPASTAIGYTGDGVCDKYWPVGQTNYARSSGTSHSTPIVAGAAVLFSQYFKHARGSFPSPAMVKAALVCGADDMAGGADGFGGVLDHRPNPLQGWGRLNLNNTLAPITSIFTHDQNDTAAFTASGQQQDFVVQPIDPNQPLRIVLAWTDPPASPLSNGAIINNLDLIVAKGGTTFYGNNFMNGLSIAGGTPDSVNNVEAVFLENPSGSYLVSVRATNLAGDGIPGNGTAIDQDYALYMINATDQTSVGTVSFGSKTFSCSGQATVQVSDRDLRNAGTQWVALVTEQGDQESLSLTETIPGTGVFSGAIALAPGQPIVGDGILQVGSGELIRVSYDDLHPGDNPPAAVVDFASIDCVPPKITNVQIVSVGFDRATVQWITDKPSTSLIYAGAFCGEPELTANSSEFVYQHLLTIHGLDTCTPYKLQVRSVDSVGNVGVDSGPFNKCYSVRTLQRAVGEDDLDPAPIGGWSHAASIGTDDWAVIATGYATSPPNAWFSADTPTVKDAYLITPPLNTSFDSIFAFKHTYDLESTYDGAVLEISTNGGSSWTDLGPYIFQGGYNGQISPNYGNPIAGRRAWTGGPLGPMTDVKVDIGSFAGASRLIRFRIGCDTSFAATGWYIDNISITGGVACPNRVEDRDWILYQ